MNRFLSLLAGGVGALAFVWGCGNTPVPDADHEDNNQSSGGSGAKPSSGGSSGIGSGGTTGGVGPSTGGTGVTGGTGNVGVGGAAGSAVAAGGAGATLSAGGMGAVGGSVSPTGGVGATGGSISPSGGMGNVGVGGAAGSGTSGSAGTGSGDNPAGYWTYNDWHGCAWTGVDTDMASTVKTTIMPKDFTAGQAANGSYCVSGAVGNTYESVGLLGFNLNQPASGTSCVYDPATASSMGPPGATLTKTGIAVNFSKTGAFTLRIQVQGPNGATDANNRWCATITDAAGPVFIPYTSFYTSCWETDTAKKGTQFNPASSPVSAVVFTVPGVKDVTTSYNFCINGFASGDSVADAPTGGMTSGPLTGTIGGSGGTDLDFQRVKVKVNGHSYIVQNNNWGNPGSQDQTLTYKDNSFVVTKSNASGSSAPGSFPSIYIGANGDTQGGLYSTSSDDHLPMQISAITSVNTTFKYTLSGGQQNAAFDIWFSANKPSSCYGDAISGFIMLWFHKPSNFSPIGSAGPTVTIGGKSWVVWTGPRGGTGSSNGSCVVQNSNAPVVSYVATSDITSWSGDLKPFFTDAVTNNRGIQSSWYLTDVFGGFEIWNGGEGSAVQEFTAIVAP